jgi:hypothetical protein
MKFQAESVQLTWLCGCGRRPVELRGLGCCRSCYYRRYHSLRFFGGLREAVLKRDRFRCRVCGKGAQLLVHHRDGHNERRLLITLCISCHVRLHRYRGLSRWIPKTLLELWGEIHPGPAVSAAIVFCGASELLMRKLNLREWAKRPRKGSFYNGAQVPCRFDIVDSRVQLTL